MKSIYVLTKEEKAYLKQVLINTLRSTSTKKYTFNYLSIIDIRETYDYVQCKISGKDIMGDKAWGKRSYGVPYKRKFPVTWFYEKKDNNFNKLLETLVLYTVANYMEFEKYIDSHDIVPDDDDNLPYSDHGTFRNWSYDENIQNNIIPSDEIKENFIKVTRMIHMDDFTKIKKSLIK